MEAAEIKAKNPLLGYAEKLGWELKKKGTEWACICPFHKDSSPSLRINPEKQVWTCDPCGLGGSIIDLHMLIHNISLPRAMEELSGEPPSGPDPFRVTKPLQSPPKPKEQASTAELKEVCVYDYQDATGKTVYQVVRYEPKTFRQRHILPDGSISWKMDGVERLPYNLPTILSTDIVFIVEGEKDVETLRKADLSGTCNSGGAKKWLPSYSQYLKNKRVYIIPDNDEPGLEHARQVLQSLEGIVEWVKWIDLPKEKDGKTIKDLTDYFETFENADKFVEGIIELESKARLIDKGVDCEIYSMVELEDRYKKEINEYSNTALSLKSWLPQLNIRDLIPGEVLGIIAGTGQLKTAAMQNILYSNPHLCSLLFELEITETLLFERNVAIVTGQHAESVFSTYKGGQRANWQRGDKFKNLYVCPRSNMSMKDIDEHIARSSAKIGKSPDVFVIDYLQLVRGKGSRYERISDAAEEAKVLAKKWKAIGIVISQIGRKQKKDDEEDDHINIPTLQAAKDSGSIENSVGLMLGVWKTSRQEMRCKILKNSKGTPGQEVAMKIEGGSFRITPQ